MLGVESIDVSYVRAASCLGAKRWQVFRHVIVPGCPALHLHRPADFGRRRLVFAGRRRDGVRAIRPRLRHQHLLHDGALSDDYHRHDHAGNRRIRDQRRDPLPRRLHDAVACARARSGRRTGELQPRRAAGSSDAERATRRSAQSGRKGGVRIVDAVKIYGSRERRRPRRGSLHVRRSRRRNHRRGRPLRLRQNHAAQRHCRLSQHVVGQHLSRRRNAVRPRQAARREPGPDRIVVFQNGALFPWKTNIENVAFGPIMQGRSCRAKRPTKRHAT